ncbi:MAG: acetyl-CoA carboxylase carboxyltransferase subunit [Actinobacteria bacterium]|nr:acetyl-CoA carboxylase carboxyltransferase subunit [Actinomycetota bacterium]
MTRDGAGEWKPTLDDLAERRASARAMGGEERRARQRDAGKLDARARVDALLDPGSFTELGTLVGAVPADAFVAGAGRIEGRPVMVGAEDFTVLGGTIAGGNNAKRYRIAELALRRRVPLVMLLEGAGHRPDDRSQGRHPTDLGIQARCSGRVPVVSAVVGPSAGHGALVAPMSDFSVMTQQAAIFTAGPPVVKESTGEDVGKEELGGPVVALASGLVHNLATDDADALAQIRRYLSYFPSSAWSYPQHADGDDQGPRSVGELLDIVPRDNRTVYDMRAVIDTIVDRGEWFQVQPRFGRAIVCALAHLGGEPVAIVANQPKVQAGSIDADAADKAAHFVTVADSFHLPLVFLADNPGMLPGTRSERAGVLRSGARMFAAQTRATVPKLHVTLRKAYGFGSMVMAMVAFENQAATFAFPGATLGAMGAGASSRAMRADADAAEALRQAELDASYRSARGLGFDELIDPRETRDALLGALQHALHQRQRAAEPVARVGITP